MPPFLESDMAGKCTTTMCIHYDPDIVSIWLNLNCTHWNYHTTAYNFFGLMCQISNRSRFLWLFDTNIALLIGYSKIKFPRRSLPTNLRCKCTPPPPTSNARAFHLTWGRKVVYVSKNAGWERKNNKKKKNPKRAKRKDVNWTSVGEIFLVSLAL